MAKREFKVLRPHLGDKMYDKGDTRVAEEAQVRHLIKAGVLSEAITEEAKAKEAADKAAADAKANSVPDTKAPLLATLTGEAPKADADAKTGKAESGAAK
ncbi:hypothetical protein [Cohaesibacter haloalkalitolerans]|uniref:hypothetical protein n=1 Tax=Cohaesibacter haloalkalitolerans TaxID=1162980 RepID=UPI000E64C44A|nr:hypothetical protein [Cohaesibacter haloalkalitolerans]